MKQLRSLRLLLGLLFVSNLVLVTVLLSGGLLLISPKQQPPAAIRQSLVQVAAPADAATIDKLAAQLGANNHDDVSMARSANAWIACSVGTTQLSEVNSVADVLTLLSGSCGWRDELFRSLADRWNLQHRRVGFLNVPTVISHATTEILAGEEWRWFDSSFGRYFCMPESPGTPISIREARLLWPDVHLATITGQLNQGTWVADSQFDYNTVPISSLSTDLIAELEQLYILSDLVVHHPSEVYLDRITIPLWLEDWRAIGHFDQSHEEMSEYALTVDGLDIPLYTPFRHLLGPYSGAGPVIDKVFEFQSLDAVSVELVLHFVDEAPRLAADVQHAVMRHTPTDRAVAINTSGASVTISFPVHPPVSRLVVRNLGRSVSLLDAIAWNVSPLNQE